MKMTEMINHAILPKKLLQDIVSQDAFVYDLADFCRKVTQIYSFPGVLLSTAECR